MTVLGRHIICSCDLHKDLMSKKYRARTIYPDAHCESGCFYYEGYNKKIRTVDLKKRQIRVQCEEFIEGFGMFPTIFQRVVRSFK